MCFFDKLGLLNFSELGMVALCNLAFLATSYIIGVVWNSKP